VAILEIRWADRLKLRNVEHFRQFCQEMANLTLIGFARYGDPQAHKLYLSRLKAEIKAYERTGNRIHLLNAANYCHLEDYAPENPKHNNDNVHVESVTRGKGKFK
jgi:hypothetical protein